MTSALTSDWQPFGPVMELGEGARFVVGRLVHVDLLAGRLYETDPAQRSTDVRLALDVPLGAVAPLFGRPGAWIAAAGTGIALLDEEGSLHWIAQQLNDAAVAMRMNDGVCDPAGRFWAGSMAYDPSAATGALYRVDADLTVTQVLDGITIPNGPAFDGTGSAMYLADSAAGIIYRCRLDAAGDVLDRTEFARVEGSPDGMTVDAEGFLWSAIWGAGVIHRYAPSGHLHEVIPVPAIQPTSVAIGGGRVFVTSATHGLERPGPDDGRTFVATTAVDGVPTASFTAPPARQRLQR